MSNESGLPDCPCFQDEETRAHSLHVATLVAAALRSQFMDATAMHFMCSRAAKLILVELVIGVMTSVALQNKNSLFGTVEALRETEAELAGFEAEVLSRMRAYYAVTIAMTPDERAAAAAELPSCKRGTN